MLRLLLGEGAISAADCARDALLNSAPLIELSDDPGDPTDCMEGCDLREVAPLVGMEVSGVDAAGVKSRPLLEEMVADCWDRAGRFDFRDPPE